jgi:hypothetical protein
MEQYRKLLEEGSVFLKNHDDLLNSLILSKQNAINNDYTNESPQGVPNGTEQPSQGINQSGNQPSA